MVGVLVMFCIINIIWGIILVYVIHLIQNKSLPHIFAKKTDSSAIEEYPEATDEQIAAELDKFRDQLKDETGFDEDGNKVRVKDEKAVE